MQIVKCMASSLKYFLFSLSCLFLVSKFAASASLLNLDQDGFHYDDELTDPNGLLYLHTRFYGNSGQFVSEDAFANNTSNRYTFANADSVNFIDPMGAKATSKKIASNIWHDNWLTKKGGPFVHSIEGLTSAVVPAVLTVLSERYAGQKMIWFIRAALTGDALSNMVYATSYDWHHPGKNILLDIENMIPLVNLANRQNRTWYNIGVDTVAGMGVLYGAWKGARYGYSRYKLNQEVTRNLKHFDTDSEGVDYHTNHLIFSENAIKKEIEQYYQESYNTSKDPRKITSRDFQKRLSQSYHPSAREVVKLKNGDVLSTKQAFDKLAPEVRNNYKPRQTSIFYESPPDDTLNNAHDMENLYDFEKDEEE